VACAEDSFKAKSYFKRLCSWAYSKHIGRVSIIEGRHTINNVNTE